MDGAAGEAIMAGDDGPRPGFLDGPVVFTSRQVNHGDSGVFLPVSVRVVMGMGTRKLL